MPKVVRRWDNPNDVAMRLNQSLIRLHGRPVWITANGDHMEIETYDIVNKDREVVDPDNPALDISAMKLGYVNEPKGIYYPFRYPIRKQKQGLAPDNSGILEVDNNGLVIDKANFIAKGRLVSPEFGRMVLNDYPSVPECVEYLDKKEDCVGRAFGRKFALVRDDVGIVKLHYFNQPIGWKKRDNTFMIGHKFGHYLPLLGMFGLEGKLAED